MVAGPRFAIYFVPAAGTALYRFGTAVLGYDCYSGERVARLRGVPLSEAEWVNLTAEPCTYGFHATLKAPFLLRGEFDQGDLLSALQTLAASIEAVPVFEPAVELIAGFVAIIPRAAPPALGALASDCVTAFERFRQPMTEAERARRLAAGLNPRQADYLDRWGYPYVFDEFRFHMTLTGRLAPDHRAAIYTLLQDEFAQRCGGGPIRLDRLALVRQDHPNAPFRVIGHAAMSRAARRPIPG